MSIFTTITCPHCNASFNNFMGATICPQCKRSLDEPISQAPPQKTNNGIILPEKKRGNSLAFTRYKDAYATAYSYIATGNVLKTAAVVVGVGFGLIGFMLMLAKYSFLVFVGGAVAGICIAIPLYGLGVMISATGQILLATLDTAVNTSPLLSKEEIQQIIPIGNHVAGKVTKCHKCQAEFQGDLAGKFCKKCGSVFDRFDVS